MGRSWGANTTGTGSTDHIESGTAVSLTLISADADAEYPATEYTAGRIVFSFSERQDAVYVEYRPDSTADPPPVTVSNWALILANTDGAVLASGVVTRAETGLNGVRRYHVDPHQAGPASPTAYPWM